MLRDLPSLCLLNISVDDSCLEELDDACHELARRYAAELKVAMALLLAAVDLPLDRTRRWSQLTSEDHPATPLPINATPVGWSTQNTIWAWVRGRSDYWSGQRELLRPVFRRGEDFYNRVVYQAACFPRRH